MLSLEIKKTVDDSELRDRLDKCFKRVWERIMLEAVVQIRNGIRETLERNASGLTADADTIRKFPFLVDLKSFVDRYVSCIKIRVGNDNIAVAVDSDVAMSSGLPENIYDLLEYGSSEFPQIPHMREALASWESVDRKLLTERFIQEVAIDMNSGRA